MRKRGYDYEDDAPLGYIASLGPVPKRSRLRVGGYRASGAGGSSGMAAAAAAAAAAQAVSARNTRTGGYIGVEQKFDDHEAATQTISTTIAGSEVDSDGGTWTGNTCLDNISQGSQQTQRDGRRCTYNSISVKGTLKLSGAEGTAVTEPAIVTVALVLDKQSNGAQLNAEDVFEVGGRAGVAGEENAFRDMENTHRFQVLRMQRHVLQPTGATSDGADAFRTGTVIRPFEMHYTWKQGLVVSYSGTGGQMADHVDYSLHLIAFTHTGAGASTITYVARTRFTG